MIRVAFKSSKVVDCFSVPDGHVFFAAISAKTTTFVSHRHVSFNGHSFNSQSRTPGAWALRRPCAKTAVAQNIRTHVNSVIPVVG